jgi:imidazolonepropionase-like amidohydrolase
MPLTDVLKSATSRAADRVGQPSLGRIAANAIADLVVLDADPTEQAALPQGVGGLSRRAGSSIRPSPL